MASISILEFFAGNQPGIQAAISQAFSAGIYLEMASCIPPELFSAILRKFPQEFHFLS